MNRPKNIEREAQLLKGIGASSWFYLSKEGRRYKITRYSEKGVLECSGLFTTNDKSFKINKPYRFTYISHCKQCVVVQEKKRYVFNLENNEY
mgnify:CR=1 FL=1|tara:strand:- start:385 stop:660 length:276 start_codon:yes stop_codon:yes gene_type:complete